MGPEESLAIRGDPRRQWGKIGVGGESLFGHVTAGHRALALRTVRTAPRGRPCRCLAASTTHTGATSRVGVTSLKVCATHKALHAAVVLFSFLSITSAWATVDPNTYTDTLTSTTGINGVGTKWSSGLGLTYTVWQDSGYYWHYRYEFSGPSNQYVSHLIVETTDRLSSLSELQIPSGGSWELDLQKLTGSANPGMPEEVYGLKVTPGDLYSFTVSFETHRVPRWVDFYAKGNNVNYAYNTGFGSPDSDPNGVSGDADLATDFQESSPGSTTWVPVSIHDHVLGPDSKSAPGLPALALLGVAPLAAFVSRKLRGG